MSLGHDTRRTVVIITSYILLKSDHEIDLFKLDIGDKSRNISYYNLLLASTSSHPP